MALLARTVERFDWILLTYCLMPNHLHLMIELREANLGRGMQWLQGQYVRHYNDRHGRPGRLFEHRYKSRAVRDELYFVTLVQYVDHNPVEAGLCSAPEEWPWSARGIVAGGSCPSWLAIDSLDDRRDELKDAT